MNDAHYHLVVNHFPIIGTILGVGILLAGIILKNNIVKNVSYCLFLVAAIFAALSTNTGGMAAGAVKEMPGVTRDIIHEHAELGEKLAFVLYFLAIVSIVGLYMNIKNHSKAKLVSIIALLIAIGAAFLSQKVGTSGGEIRHTEIRKDLKDAQHEESEHQDED